LVGLFMASGVAGASAPDAVRLPVSGDDRPATNVETEVVVQRGDHLWKISARYLQSHAPERAIAGYWLDVIDENVSRLRSGDPDLIYPGEVISMPGLNERP
jgi:nucleoid-associated protein YgaU